MAKDSPITNFLNDEEKAILTPAAAALTAGDLMASMRNHFGTGSHTDAGGALTSADWKSIGRAFAAQAARRHG